VTDPGTAWGGLGWRGTLVAMLLLTGLGPAIAQPGSDDRMGLVLYRADTPTGHSAPRLESRVTIDVHGTIIRARVTQRFINPGDQWVEGVYVFPLPDNAAVDRLEMRIGERRIHGEIQERQQAAATYRQARARGQAATLLSQQRPNIFTAAVANIGPGEQIEVEIRYQDSVEWRDDAFALRFPMVVAPRYIPGQPLVPSSELRPLAAWGTDEVPDAGAITPPVARTPRDADPSVQLEVRLNPGLPLGGIESPYHPTRVETLSGDRYRVRLANGPVPADRDFVLRWRPAASAQPRSVLFRERWKGSDYLMVMMVPPDQGPQTTPVARELVLVIDTSGSMHGDSLAQARRAVEHTLGQLEGHDHFNIIQFNSTTDGLFVQSRPANGRNLELARDYLRRLEAEGGTEIRAALRRALSTGPGSGRLRQVVFLTDGAVGNEQAAFQDIQDHLGESRLFTVGIGSAPNAHFMRRAARLGRGSHTFVGHAAEVESQLARLIEGLRHPVLTDFSLHWSLRGGAGEVTLGTETLPDLYAGQPLVFTAMTTGAASGVTVRARRGTDRWASYHALSGGGAAAGIHALWARRRIAAWMDSRVSGVDEARIRHEVLALALRHRLVSPYTSLVAVDRTPRRDPGENTHRHDVALRLPAGWSAHKVLGQLPATATPAALFGTLSLVALLAAIGLWWDGRRPCRDDAP